MPRDSSITAKENVKCQHFITTLEVDEAQVAIINNVQQSVFSRVPKKKKKDTIH